MYAHASQWSINTKREVLMAGRLDGKVRRHHRCRERHRARHRRSLHRGRRAASSPPTSRTTRAPRIEGRPQGHGALRPLRRAAGEGYRGGRPRRETAFRRLDGLFNNAGTGGANEAADAVTAEGFDAVMHLHVRAALFGIKYAVPLMRVAGGGAIISTASVAGIRTGYGPLLYSTPGGHRAHDAYGGGAARRGEHPRPIASAPA